MNALLAMPEIHHPALSLSSALNHRLRLAAALAFGAASLGFTPGTASAQELSQEWQQEQAPFTATPRQPAAPLPPGTRSITLPEQVLNTALGTRFPITRSVQGLLQLELSHPNIRLQPEINRLHTRLSLQVSEPFTGRTHTGNAQLLHGLRFHEADRSLRLSDIEVTELDFPALPEPYRGLLRQHAPALIAQALPELPLYTAQNKEMALINGLGFQVGAIDVTPKGLRVALRSASTAPSDSH